MHNAGRAACERVFGIYARINRKEGLEPWPAFERLLDETASPARRRLVDPNLRLAASEVMDDCYAAATHGAAPDLAKVPTVARVNYVMSGRRKAADLHDHHTVPIHWAQRLGVPSSEHGGMPALLLHRTEHVGVSEGGTASFHRVLSQYLRRDQEYDPEQILDGLRQAYEDVGRPEVWDVAREWLRTRGIE